MPDRDAAYLAESNAWKLLSTMTIFIGLSWLSVALRIYTRAFLMKGLQLDDWLMLLSQVRSGLGGVDVSKGTIPLTSELLRLSSASMQDFSILEFMRALEGITMPSRMKTQRCLRLRYGDLRALHAVQSADNAFL